MKTTDRGRIYIHDKRLEELTFEQLCDEMRTPIYTALFKGKDELPTVVSVLLSLGYKRGVNDTKED